MEDAETKRHGDEERLSPAEMARALGLACCDVPFVCGACLSRELRRVWIARSGKTSTCICDACLPAALEKHMREQAHLDSIVEAVPHDRMTNAERLKRQGAIFSHSGECEGLQMEARVEKHVSGEMCETESSRRFDDCIAREKDPLRIHEPVSVVDLESDITLLLSGGTKIKGDFAPRMNLENLPSHGSITEPVTALEAGSTREGEREDIGAVGGNTKAVYNTRRSMQGDGSGFLCLAGPYAATEKWMMERVVADLVSGSIRHEVRTGEYFGMREQSFVWRDAAGYKFVRGAEHANYSTSDEPDQRFVRRRTAT